ncbi:hypothetical protein FZI91_19365 [Mycobacterium sp. CBMA271]|uniref:hypothetical protein n=1 Tax=unclassified Mycobacteroides TaxID=2618759 RepID=UPI0012DDDADB|nr:MULTISPECIES: hypothetical protein [unclassified Mycobacteroides]MUM17174.1 hypothetical protein [Mycobacteroides sp. CBMA 326]MUM23843.1 hypothetical protein [Mycobacteroides sp. CBMA 271]
MRIKALALALLIAMAASGCMWIHRGKEITGPTVNDQGFSLLTEAGIDRIKRTKRGRFDVRTGILTKAAVGLENLPYPPMIGHPGGGEMTFTFLGPNAEENVVTENITFDTSDLTHNVDMIVWFSAPNSMTDSHAELRAGIQRWGYRPEDVEAWGESVNWPKSPYSDRFRSVIGMGVGRSGLVTEVQGTRKDGNEILRYQMYLEEKYYKPEVQEIIRETGRSERWPPTPAPSPPAR